MEKNISELKEQIYFLKTKEYFEEVEKSFYNENYRSAIVILYSIVIADLLFKLEELKDYYADSVAEEILKNINKMRECNPKSSEWENKLIENLKEKTNIIEPYVLANIEDLKNVRNFSAHPSLNQNNELIRPSREKTLGLIKEMLVGIFIRPPLFIKKITNNIVEDIADKKDVFLEDGKKFEKYIEKKYFERIPENMLVGIFKDFWKFTFKLDNDDCNENRKINLKLLMFIMKKNKLKIIEDLQKEKNRYNNISDNGNIVVYLIEFMYYFPEVFSYLNSENQIVIELTIEKNNSYKSIAYFVAKNLEEHIKSLDACNLKDKKLREMLEKKMKTEGMEYLLFDQYIEIYGKSSCYDEADSNFDSLINPNLDRMKQKQIEKIIENTNKNNQIYNRGKAKFNNNQIIEKANINWNLIDFNQYINFKFDQHILM